MKQLKELIKQYYDTHDTTLVPTINDIARDYIFNNYSDIKDTYAVEYYGFRLLPLSFTHDDVTFMLVGGRWEVFLV